MLIRTISIISNTMAPPANNGQGAQPNGRPNGGQGRAQEGANGPAGVDRGEVASPTDEEMEVLRSNEIAGKAITGTLILLLKWLKISRGLKRHRNRVCICRLTRWRRCAQV